MRPRLDPARPAVLMTLIAVQGVCTAVFLGDIISDLLEPGMTETEGPHALIEGLATLGLMAAIVVELRLLAWLFRQKAQLEASLLTAQSAVQEVIDAQLSSWSLTPAERDVATFLIKGLNTADIARMRGSAEGTVKAQLNAIYRKSGSANRTELMSSLIDTMMGRDTADPETKAS